MLQPVLPLTVRLPLCEVAVGGVTFGEVTVRVGRSPLTRRTRPPGAISVRTQVRAVRLAGGVGAPPPDSAADRRREERKVIPAVCAGGMTGS
ncbi:hypothetical protein GCM10008021_18930 [Deinococcus wulumuqiensis]|uniref:Uncharacterized protein n=1 Tax=Deinococcus wulumuqiensis TaxID=980427 RepID=A0ABQ2PXM3_9DEIO|nr:hypothetical protein GCM10008021_18930 [Deinococcus wulumuqiensis]